MDDHDAKQEPVKRALTTSSRQKWALDDDRIAHLLRPAVQPPAGLDRFREIVRELAEAADVAEEAAALEELAGFDIEGIDDFFEDLGFDSPFGDPSEFGSDGGERRDGLPDDAPPSGFPSSNRGFAGNVWKDPDGTVHKVVVDQHADGGGYTRNHSTYNESTGVSTEDNVYHRHAASPGGSVNSSQRRETDENGSRLTTRFRTRDGLRIYEANWDTEGRLVRTRIVESDNSGGVLMDQLWAPETGWQDGPTINPNPDEPAPHQQELADWLWRQHKLGKHTPPGAGPRSPNRVNPGDPEGSGATFITVPSIWTYVDPGSLAGNPDPNAPIGSERPPSREVWALMVADLRRRALGPGGHPGGPEDGRDDR